MQAPALTLLLPLDRVGACGHCSRSLHVPLRGCTRQQLLYSIYEFYQVGMCVPAQLLHWHLLAHIAHCLALANNVLCLTGLLP